MKMLRQIPSFLRRGQGWLIGRLAPAPTTPYLPVRCGGESFPWPKGDPRPASERGKNRENAKKMLK
jgi:hypothetical protein